MSCTFLTRSAGPAPIWHQAVCRECRAARRADRLIAFAIACRKEEAPSSEAIARCLAALDLPRPLPRTRGANLATNLRRSKRLIAGVAACLTLTAWGWTVYIDVNPNMPIPLPQIHGSNAYDDFERAASLVRDSDLTDLIYNQIESQAEGDRAATKELPGKALRKRQAPGVTISDLEAHLRKNRAALVALRAGFGKEYLAPPLRSFTQPLKHLESSRSLARLLVLDARAHAARGRWGLAARSALDCIELGVTIQQNSGLIGRLTGMGIEALGRAGLSPEIERLDAAEAAAAASRLERILQRVVPLTDTLEEESRSTLAGLQNEMRRPGWRRRLLAGLNGEEAAWQDHLLSYLRLLPYSKSAILQNSARQLDAQIRSAAAPFTPPGSIAGGQTYSPLGEYGEVSDPGDPVTAMIMPVYNGARFRDLVNQTQNRLILINLALRAFRLENGRYPAALSELVPRYLRTMPQDPFGAPTGRPRYSRTANTYILYSVGPNGVDDGGVPITKSGSPPRSGSTPIEPNSSGDILAGRSIN